MLYVMKITAFEQMNHVFAYAMFLSVWFISSPAQFKYWAPKERIYWVTTYTMIAKDFELKTTIDWLIYIAHNFLLFWLEEMGIQHNSIRLITKFFVWTISSSCLDDFAEILHS